MKYAWIDAQRRDYPLSDLCEVLSVSASGDRAWRGAGSPASRRPNDARGIVLVKAIHAEVEGAYGSPIPCAPAVTSTLKPSTFMSMQHPLLGPSC